MRSTPDRRHPVPSNASVSHYCVLLALLLSLLAAPSTGQVSVLTQHNDNSRTGANLSETILNASTVNVGTFGKINTLPLDGHVYAQPLYVPKVHIRSQGIHNVVFVATAHNTVYAFDADATNTHTPLWSRNLGPSVPSTLINTLNILVEVGIIGTPAINVQTDPVTGQSTGVLYVAAKTLENGVQVYRLHALDITSGLPIKGSPVLIQATVPGTGDGGSSVTFAASQQCSRPGVLIANGMVYLAFASHEDYTPYHGWIFGYNMANLSAPPIVYNTTPNGGLGGIWMGGQGLVADSSGYLYCMVGNGTSDAKSGGTGYGEAFLKLAQKQQSLTVADWFMPFDADSLNNGDTDIGSGGPLLIPGTKMLVGGGKSGKLYVVNTASMGSYHAGSDSQIVQNFYAYNGEYRNGPVYWKSPDNGPQIYVWGGSDVGRAYKLVNGMLMTTAASQSTFQVSNGASNSPAMSISASGATLGTGILWATMSSNGDSDHNTVPGEIHALDASNIAHELWNSNQNPARDIMGNWAKFCAPTIANGKVYVATHSGQLVVYGLTPAHRTPPSGRSLSVDFVGGGPNGTPSPMSPTEIAGAIPRSHWNSAGTTAAGTLPHLVDDQGTVTPITVTWSCDNLWSLPITETAGNARMMKGYLDNGGGNPTTVTFANIPLSLRASSYDVYVYCDGDNGGNRTGVYTIGNTTLTLRDNANNNFGGGLLETLNGAGNYVVFRSLYLTTFTLTATPGATDDAPRAPINGIQIVAHKP